MITSRNIVDVRHRLGATNVIADAISRKWSKAKGPSNSSDGADWSVQPGWETRQGIMKDIMQIRGTKSTDKHVQLSEQFADDPWLSKVVELLTNQDMPDLCTRRRARHWEMNFTIDNGKLWYTCTMVTDRAT